MRYRHTVTVDVGVKADPFSASPSADYFARYGTVVLDATNLEVDPVGLHAALVEAIRADSRVVTIEPGAMDPNWTLGAQMYPAYRSPAVDVLLSGADHMHTVRFSDGILFELQVPSKNQPRIHGEAPKPENYLIAWDGMTVVVLWKRKRLDDFAASAAGQVAIHVIREATAKVGARVYLQPCSAGCKLLFGHMAMSISHWAGTDFAVDSAPGKNGWIAVRIAGPHSKLELVEAVHDEIKMAAGEFSLTKNLAQRIIDIDRSAQELTAELIKLDYEALRASQRNFLSRQWHYVLRVLDWVRGRSKGKRARYLIAALWLAMASIQTLQQAHAGQRRDYEDTVEDSPALAAMFQVDLKTDEMVVETLDASFARAAVEHKTTRMDTRSVAGATVIGAAVGGLLALLGGWLAAAGGIFT